MKARLEDRNKAIELRRKGLSYKEIQTFVRVSKGLLSMWLSDLELSPAEEKQLESKILERKKRGRLNSKISNQTRRLERERRTLKEAEIIFKKRKGDPQFLMGIALFWAHGSKSSSNFNFMSTDTDMIFIMFAWVQKYLSVGKDRVRVRICVPEDQPTQAFVGFWAKNLGISENSIAVSREKTRKTKHITNPYYKGCVRLTVVGVTYKRLMATWQRLYIDLYGKALLSHKV